MTKTTIRASRSDHARLLQAAVDGERSILSGAPDALLQSAYCTSGCSVLHYAAGYNQLAIVDYLVRDRGFDNVNIAVPKRYRKAQGRTPLHYAARNGHVTMVRHLVETYGANENAFAKHNVTPLQLAVWRNQVSVAQYLVMERGVDPAQANEFGCTLLHWLAIAPIETESEEGDDGAADEAVIATAEWLISLPGVSVRAKQKQGHTALHKAAWQGHYGLVQYLHQKHELWDDSPDHAGNYAADLADMAPRTRRHVRIAQYLRRYASPYLLEACRTLGIPVEQARRKSKVQAAYYRAAKQLHPDALPRSYKQQADMNIEVMVDASEHEATSPSNRDKDSAPVSGSFQSVATAYQYLMRIDDSENDENDLFHQRNPKHSLPLMLQLTSASSNHNPHIIENSNDQDHFQARLMAVLLEYGSKGLDLSNIKKKWRQVWPETSFPDTGSLSLSAYLRKHASDIVELRMDDRNCLRVHAKCVSDYSSLSGGVLSLSI